MQKNEYLKCNVDHCCYFRKVGSNYITLLFYVDDRLVVSTYLDEINKLKKQLSNEFEIQDLGVAKQILRSRISIVTNKHAPCDYLKLSIFVRYCKGSI